MALEHNGQNPGSADKMGISGVALWRLALLWLYLFDEYWIWGGYHDTCLICFTEQVHTLRQVSYIFPHYSVHINSNL